MANIGNTAMKRLAAARTGVKTKRESSWDRSGGDGGSGIVIVRYALSAQGTVIRFQ